jgi:hypothetical protein
MIEEMDHKEKVKVGVSDMDILARVWEGKLRSKSFLESSPVPVILSLSIIRSILRMCFVGSSRCVPGRHP